MSEWNVRPLAHALGYALLASLVAGLAGCKHAIVVPAMPDEGTSSYRFIDPPPPAGKKRDVAVATKPPDEQTMNAQPILPLARPVYPVAALAARAGLATVSVRVVVDTDGRVAEVTSSLAHLSMPSPFAAEFRAAVDAAVERWRFRPAEIVRLETVKDRGGDYQRVAARDKIAWAFDVEFTFGATGDVLTQLPK